MTTKVPEVLIDTTYSIDAGALDGNESALVTRGAGVLETTLTKIAQWVIQTYKGFTQSGAGAVARTVQDKQRERVSLLDFGADPTGATDSYTAIMAFWSALKISGKKGYVPKGTYKSNTAVVWDMSGLGANGVAVEGDGQHTAMFDLTSVTTSPAFMITKSDGAAFYSSFRDFSINTNIAGVSLQLGRTDFADPLNSFHFQNMWIGNSNAASTAVVQVNYVLGSTFTNVVPAGHHSGDSWQWNACAFCTWIGGSGTWAANGIHMTAGGAGNGAIQGNTVIGMDFEENVHASVKIDTANAKNNTFIGGTFVYNPNTYTPWAASTTYALNAVVTANNAVYQVTSAGTSASSGSGPSDTGSSITDGTVVWKYLNGGNSFGVDAMAGTENFFFNPNTMCYPSGTPSYANFFANTGGTGILGKWGMTVGMEMANPSFSATMSASQTLSAGTWTKLQFNTATWQGGQFSYDATTNFRFTAPLPGRYRFKACLNTNATNAASAVGYVALYKNGSNVRAAGSGIPAGTNFVAPQIDAMLYLNAGDYVECWASIPASTGSPVVSGGTTSSFFEGNYLG